MGRRTTVKPKQPCSNCGPQRPPGTVIITSDDHCVLCNRNVEDSAAEFYHRARIEAQAERLGELLESHNGLSGHSVQSVLADDILIAAKALVAAHNGLAESRVPEHYDGAPT